MSDDPIRVLLIEDSSTAREMVGGYFEELGADFQLETCEDLASGLSRLDRGDTHVVLLDLNLPDSKGVDTCARVRSEAPWVPIVILTVEEERELTRTALQQGAQDYLVKGEIDAGALDRALRHGIERHILFMEAEKRHREAEAAAANLRNLLEDNAYGMVVVDHHGIVRFVNRAAEDLLGTVTREVVGGPFGFPLIAGPPREIAIYRGNRDEAAAEIWVGDIEWDGQAMKVAHLRDLRLGQGSSVNLNTEIMGLEEDLDAMLGEEVGLIVDLCMEELQVRIPSRRLRQVLFSMVDNAFRAEPGGGTIRVATAAVELGSLDAPRPIAIPHGPYAQVRIEDDGYAFSEDPISEVLNPWPGGLDFPRRVGPGLVSACSIALDAGGCVWLESRPDRGSTLEVYLPRLAQP